MLGLNPNKIMHGTEYADLSALSEDRLLEVVKWLPDRRLVILPFGRYSLNIPSDIREKTIALVGNGIVLDSGPAIDNHDIVVRINSAYAWKESCVHDGLRCDWWFGRGGMDIVRPRDYLDGGHPDPNVQICSLFPKLSSIFTNVHTNLEAGFVRMLLESDCFDKFSPLLSAPYVFDLFDSEVFLLRDSRFAEICMSRKYHSVQRQWGGFYGFELLLTGVAACLRFTLAKPKKITLFGFDFYSKGGYIPWEMHHLDDNRYVMDTCFRYCENHGIEISAYKV